MTIDTDNAIVTSDMSEEEFNKTVFASMMADPAGHGLTAEEAERYKRAEFELMNGIGEIPEESYTLLVRSLMFLFQQKTQTFLKSVLENCETNTDSGEHTIPFVCTTCGHPVKGHGSTCSDQRIDWKDYCEQTVVEDNPER
jgi:hypothetical protein